MAAEKKRWDEQSACCIRCSISCVSANDEEWRARAHVHARSTEPCSSECRGTTLPRVKPSRAEMEHSHFFHSRLCQRDHEKNEKKKKKNHQGVNNLFEYSKHTSFHWTQLIVPWYSPWQPLPPRLSSVDHLNWPQFTMQRGERGRGSRRPGMIGKRRVQRGGGVRRSDEGEQAFAASACSLWLSKRCPSFIYSDIEFNCVSRGGLRFWTDLWTEVKACGKHGGATTSMWRAQRGGGLWNVMFFFFINRLCHWRQGVAFNHWPSGCELCHFQGVTVWRHMYVGQRSALILSKKG